MLTVYGIKTCDTVTKTLKWLDAEGIAYRFFDLRADGLTAEIAQRWVDALGWESVLNRRSTTWRELPDTDKEALDAAKAVRLLVSYPTLVKRPMIEGNGRILNGFSDAVRAKLAGLT
ncbi:MAG: arsenate reductase [Rhodospirillales bacterium]|nr:arsenate reductase [Rhodospirillales bacterium]